MADYGVHGKKGTGKSKWCIKRAQEAAMDGRRVATNLDINVEKLVPSRQVEVVRIPDRPTRRDLDILGQGCDGPYNEDKFGVLILDEMFTWLNARDFNQAGRRELIDWLVHARKLRWDVYYIAQGLGMIDKSVREDLVEYDVKCMRMDKVLIPFLGPVLRQIYRPLGYLPKFHTATAKLGQGNTAMVAERWSYLGKDLHGAYDTEQVFRADYPHAPHCLLPPPGHRYPLGWLARLRQAFAPPPAKRVGVRAPRPRLVEQLQRCLPPDERIYHAQRLVRLGLL